MKKFIIMLLICSSSFALPPESNQSKLSPQYSLSVDNVMYINANKILMFVTNNGKFGRDFSGIFGYDYGTFFPYVSNDFILNTILDKSPLYAAGLMIGGKVNDSIRMAITEFDTEFVPGPMENGTFMSDRSEFKVYKLYADSLASNPNSDYLNWPTDQGAPTTGFGQPEMRGDQMLWAVFNDADPSAHRLNSGSTLPLGIEVQMTTWAYDEDGTDTIPGANSYEVTQHGSSSFIVTVDIIDQSALTGNDYAITFSYDSSNHRHWDLLNVTTGLKVLEGQTKFNGSASHGVTDGFQVRINESSKAKEWIYESASPQNLSPIAITEDPSYDGGRWFTGVEGGGDLFFGGVFIEPNFWGETTVGFEDMPSIDIRWRPMQSYTDLNGDGTYTIGEPYIVDDTTQTQKAYMYSSFDGGSYLGYFDVPFTAWDVSDSLNPRQVSVVVRDRDQNHAWNPHVLHEKPETDITNLPNSGDLRFNYIMISNSDYDPTGTYYGDGTSGTVDWWDNYNATWVMWLDDRNSGGMLAEEGSFTLVPGDIDTIPDTFSFNTTPYAPITTGADGTSIYMMYKLFNKGGNQIDSCYFSLWSDPDLGSAADDLVGCDTLSDIHYCYNASDSDKDYGNPPPAIGYKFIHGPLVPSTGETAQFDNAIQFDSKNLGMSSFIKFLVGTDPQDFSDTYEYMKGLYARTGGFPYVYNGDTLTYMHSGDPVTGSGDLDFAAGDRRMMATAGPFDFAPGDSQYVLIKMAVGQGTDKLSSVTKLKEILNIPYKIQTDINDNKPNVLPLSFSLTQNYPNPFNPKTRIQFSIPAKSDVLLEVFNILGQKVTTLVDKNMPAGNHFVNWDASDVSTGLYFYKITAGKYSKSKKMLLLK